MIKINDPFWSPRRELNRREALLYQWEQYESCGTLDNFRIIGEERKGCRKGYFYTDSDIHKWADAASRALQSGPDKSLEALLNKYIELMEEVQEEDGYLFTWNQIYFPGLRWKSIQVEHELYTMGHFIEAGLSHHQATGSKRLLSLVIKTADLIVRDFRNIGSSRTPGHQEIEAALVRLYSRTGKRDYLEAASSFLYRRGRSRLFGFIMLRDVLLHGIRNHRAGKQDRGSGELGFEFGENIQSREPRFLMFRSFLSFLDGSYQQQHRALLKQKEAKGHAVRWAYMMYGATLLAGESKSAELLPFLRECWQNLVRKKMYITGGIGSLPVIEGFGRDYELNNEFSYSETCAAIGSIFWNRELFRLSPRAEYADLIERQLYNAASVGISLDGKKYFYRNPLESHGELERQSWFETACCPSNISRLWADIHSLIFHEEENCLYINQYMGCSARFESSDTDIEIQSGFPWEGRVVIKASSPMGTSLRLRIPGWASAWEILVDGSEVIKGNRDLKGEFYCDTMGGARFETVELPGKSESLIEIRFPMEILANRAHPKIKDNRGRRAFSRGPLIYCLESPSGTENCPDPSTLRFEMDSSLFPETIGVIRNPELTLIPYYIWGNRGKQKMKVWLR